jgi:hypothetical protein
MVCVAETSADQSEEILSLKPKRTIFYSISKESNYQFNLRVQRSENKLIKQIIYNLFFAHW